MECLDNYIRVT